MEPAALRTRRQALTAFGLAGAARGALVGLALIVSAAHGAKPEAAAPADGRRFLRDCADCPRLVVIPGGSFLMGSPPDEPLRHANEGPQTTVHVASYAIGETEVTRGQYAVFVRETKRRPATGCITDRDGDGSGAEDPTASWSDPGFQQRDDHPVVCVSWQEAIDYAAWLSRRTGKRFRLPSESEWEYAARGGAKTAFFWGAVAEDGCRFMNGADHAYRRGMPKDTNLKVECDDGLVLTGPVGGYPPNPFGIRDITGNAWELVEDCWVPTLAGIPTDGSARGATACEQHLDRGGSFDDYPEDLRLASRHHVGSNARWANTGFRIARDLSATEGRP